MLLFVLIFVSVLLTGCGATNHFAAFVPQFMPAPGSRVRVDKIIYAGRPLDRAEVPAGFTPASELKFQIESKLAAADLAAAPDSPDTIILTPTITAYEPGSAGLRWVSNGATGATELTVKCIIQQNGIDVGKINIRRTIEFGGLYTIGQWKIIYSAVAGDIVDALKKKIRPDT
jgi:hypothetical protein